MPAATIDPVSLEILWSRLVAVTEEQAAVIIRTAFSSIVRESYDFTCVLLTANGDLLAQPYQSIPGFTRCASTVMKAFLDRWSDWHPEDVAITNDPWLAAGHLHDIALAVPIVHKGKIVGFSANIAHQADIGGRGYSADAASIYEEGLALPPMKLVEGGREKPEVLQIIAENVRVPGQVLGDIRAQINAARLGAKRVIELMTEAGLDTLDEVAEAIFARSEKAMRQAISRIPDGVYTNVGVMDGFDAPLTIALKVTVKGDEIELDYEGTSPQISKGINSCFNYTFGYSAFAVKAAFEPLIANNEGAIRPIRMKAPAASLVNSRHPAPGGSRARVGHFVVIIAMGALAKAAPHILPAEAGSPAPRLNFFGPNDDGSEFQCLVVTSGGTGALPGRDGLSCKSFPTNTRMASLEVMESNAPILFRRRELVPDSGGAGRFRGGLGQDIEIEVTGRHPVYLSTSVERMKLPAAGAAGGAPGLPATLVKNGSEYLHPKARSMLKPGETVTVRTPGGGGFGPPGDRSPEAVKRDLAEGYVGAQQAAARHHAAGKAPQQDRTAQAAETEMQK